MNAIWPLTSVVAGALIAWWSARWHVRSPRVPLRANHRGNALPLALGRALFDAALLGSAAGLLLARTDVRADRLTLNAIIAVIVLYLVGSWDDRTIHPERGFRQHLGGVLRGRVTTGVVKLAVGLAAAVTVAIGAGGGALRVVAATLVVASSTNLWNALDVQPGRALKAAVGALLPLLALGWNAPFGFLAAGTLGAAGALLPFDLGERGMLGDAGSNPLGFVVGVGFAVVLSTPWLVVAAAVMLALTLAAETITLSRLIRAVPPLRWLDGLGRRPA